MGEKEVEKNNEVKKNNLKMAVIVIIILLLVYIVVLFATKDIRLKKNFKNLGADFYSNYYYERISKDKNSKDLEVFLKDFENIGIKVSFANLEKYSSKGNEKIIKKLKDAKCDESNSIVTIYPKKPYGKNDYKLDVKLDCKK